MSACRSSSSVPIHYSVSATSLLGNWLVGPDEVTAARVGNEIGISHLNRQPVPAGLGRGLYRDQVLMAQFVDDLTGDHEALRGAARDERPASGPSSQIGKGAGKR